MQTITVEEIVSKLKTLSEDKLTSVYYFVSYLAGQNLDVSDIPAKELMFANEAQIARDRDTPEEDEVLAEEISEEIKSA